MAYKLCPRVIFPSRKVFVDDVFFGLVEKTILTYVHSTFANYILGTYTFTLWMSKCVHDVFTIVVNFLSNKWKAKHVTIGLFEMFDTNGVAMTPRLHQLLDKFSLTQKIFVYVKDEGFNIHTYASALNFVVSCVSLAMMESFNGSYFGHALSKVCQYATTDDKVAHGLSYAFINSAQVDIHKCITWPKKFGKGRLAWDNVAWILV
jgi:hypothetical protein